MVSDELPAQAHYCELPFWGSRIRRMVLTAAKGNSEVYIRIPLSSRDTNSKFALLGERITRAV